MVLPSHPLCELPEVSLEALAAYDLITYDPQFAGRGHIDRAFNEHRLRPRIVLEATDSDVIKTYVRLGLGVGIVSELAFAEDENGAVAAKVVRTNAARRPACKPCPTTSPMTSTVESCGPSATR